GWGYSSDYELGISSFAITPFQIAGLPAVKAVGAGTDHSLAVDTSGNVWAWGKDDYGEAGQPPTDVCENHNRPCVRQPTQMPSFGGVVAVAGGWGHSLALKADGTVWAWGRNDAGELGIGTTSTG